MIELEKFKMRDVFELREIQVENLSEVISRVNEELEKCKFKVLGKCKAIEIEEKVKEITKIYTLIEDLKDDNKGMLMIIGECIPNLSS